MPLNMKKPENKEIARIRMLPTHDAYCIHYSGETVKQFNKRMKYWKADGKKGLEPKHQPGVVRREPPKDFKALRAERKACWKQLMHGAA